MLDQFHPVGIVGQGVTRDTGRGLVGSGKAAVDDQELAAALDGAFALLALHGDVAAYDLAVLPVKAELVEDPVHHLLVFDQLVIRDLRLLVGGLVQDELPLEGGHALLAEKRAPLTAPEIVDEVGGVFLFGTFIAEIGLADVAVDGVHQGFALVRHPVQHHGVETAVRVDRDAGMVEKVAVDLEVEAPLVQQETDVPLQLFAVLEGEADLIDDQLLADRELVRVFAVDGREVHVLHRPDDAVHGDGLVFVVDLVEKEPVLHFIFGMALHPLAFQLELQDGGGLVHACVEGQVLAEGVGAALDGEGVEIALAVFVDREAHERDQVDAVAVFEDVQVRVAGGQAEDRGDAERMAAGGADPYDVVVAPLDIQRVVVHQVLHDEMWPGTSVIDVADEVQVVDGQADDHGGEGIDAALRAAGRDDGIQNALIVAGLVRDVVVGHQFFDEIAEILGNGPADLRTGILDRNAPCDADEAQQLHAVPLVHVGAGFLDERDLFLRIIDERCELSLVFAAQFKAEFQVDLAADASGTVLQDVGELFVFAVNVADEVLGALRQVQDGREIDDFSRGFGDARVLIRKRFQIAQVVLVHLDPPRDL